MAAVIYNLRSKRIKKSFKTLKGASIALNRCQDKYKGCEACTIGYFKSRVDYLVIVTNLMTNEEVSIRASQRGTVNDPSTKRYWTT